MMDKGEVQACAVSRFRFRSTLKHGKRERSRKSERRKMHANFFRCARSTRIYAAIDTRDACRSSPLTDPTVRISPSGFLRYDSPLQSKDDAVAVCRLSSI